MSIGGVIGLPAFPIVKIFSNWTKQNRSYIHKYLICSALRGDKKNFPQKKQIEKESSLNFLARFPGDRDNKTYKRDRKNVERKSTKTREKENLGTNTETKKGDKTTEKLHFCLSKKYNFIWREIFFRIEFSQ